MRSLVLLLSASPKYSRGSIILHPLYFKAISVTLISYKSVRYIQFLSPSLVFHSFFQSTISCFLLLVVQSRPPCQPFVRPIEHHLRCLFVNISKITVQFSACEKRGVNCPFMFLQIVFVSLPP